MYGPPPPGPPGPGAPGAPNAVGPGWAQPPAGPASQWGPWPGGPLQPPPGPVGYPVYQQPRRSNAGPMVIGGVVIVAFAVLLIASFMTFGQGLGTFAEGSTLETLVVGQCFNGGRPDTPAAGTPLVNRVDVVACSVPHDSELVGAFDYPSRPGATYPGDEFLASYAQSECYFHFERYVGVPFPRSSYELTYVSPVEFNWLMNDKSVQCLVHPPDRQEHMTGTVRDSRR